MNILDKLVTIAGLENAFIGTMPARPDACISLFEYSGVPPGQYFGRTDIVQNIQVRARDRTAAAAYTKAEAAAGILNRYHDDEISILQSTPVLDIGVDSNNPPRYEYTVNFTIRRL